MKTIRRDTLKKMVAAGQLEARCDGHYTDDYAYDAASNFGKTDWMPARMAQRVNPYPELSEEQARPYTHYDYPDGFMSFRDFDFEGDCGRAYWQDDAKTLVHLRVHSNLSYTFRVIEAKLKDRLFAGCFPTGIGYADTTIEEHGDYKSVAFLPFSSLKLEIRDPKSPLLPFIRIDALKIQQKRGQQYVVSGCGQTVMLGAP